MSNWVAPLGLGVVILLLLEMVLRWVARIFGRPELALSSVYRLTGSVGVLVTLLLLGNIMTLNSVWGYVTVGVVGGAWSLVARALFGKKTA